MKIRNGFVSNSSSSSFIVKKSNLNWYTEQILLRHAEIAALKPDDAWDIRDEGDSYRASTFIDNFDLIGVMEAFNIPIEYVCHG